MLFLKKKYCLYPHFKEHKGSIYLCFTDTHEKVCASLEFQLSIQSIQISPWTVNSPCSLEVSFISLVPHLVEVLGIRVSEALWRLNGWFSNWKVSKPLSVDCHVCWPNTEAFLCIFSQKLSDCYPTRVINVFQCNFLNNFFMSVCYLLSPCDSNSKRQW